MQLKRFFTTAECKNTYQYIDSQKKYEIIRTILYFGVSAALFVAGYLATKSKTNLLTVAAVLGCLPASKSLISAIMFCRFHSCSEQTYQKLPAAAPLDQLYDLVFTTEKVTYVTAHAAYAAKCLVLFSENALDTLALEKHIQEYMLRAGISNVNVKVYTDIKKYSERLNQLASLEREEGKLAEEVMQLLKEITL